jgi:Xaa-Pro dipeptidase
MTFHCIPGIWSPELTVVISESFEVTASGGRAFADFPRMLLEKV